MGSILLCIGKVAVGDDTVVIDGTIAHLKWFVQRLEKTMSKILYLGLVFVLTMPTSMGTVDCLR